MHAVGPDTLYILSAGHSGSTLLNLILGTHSRAIAVSELTYLPGNISHNEICTCGSAIRECVLWREVAARLHRRLGIDILRHPTQLDLGCADSPRGPYRAMPHYRWLWKARRMAVIASMLGSIHVPRFARQRFDRCIENRLAVYDALRAATGATMVVDSSKEYLQGLSVYAARPKRTRLILLTRDGRAVFYSNLKRGFGHAYSLRSWHNYYRHALPLIRRNVPGRDLLTVRYEDLVTSPEEVVAQICSFAGMEFEPAMLDTGSKQHHITSGNNMRFTLGTGIRLDRKWQSELKEPDRRFFEERAGWLNRELGYG